MTDVIIEHLDIWTSAVVTKKSAGRGSSKKQETYGIKKLRELILELAVRGKLVPQDPNDEPASVLLEKIAEEKERLIEEEKIKRHKPLPKIDDNFNPFKLPEGWSFVRLGDITNRIGSGSTPRGGKSAYVEKGIPFLRSQNIWNHGLNLYDVAYISEETHAKMSNTTVYENDILLNITGGSLGRSTIFPSGIGEANVSQHVTIIRLTDITMKNYVHLCILSPYIQKMIWDRQVGVAREGLSKKVLELFEIPLPPIKEQYRIVKKVDELMALCDKLEEEQEENSITHQILVETLLGTLTNVEIAEEFTGVWQRIAEHFDVLFTTEQSIDKLQETILQLAVMGKLVPQDPTDEPASVLLKKIAEEKEKLVKEGKIKKQKPVSEIEEKEIPFSLPKSWTWARLSELCILENGDRSKNYPNKSLLVDKGIPFINAGHLQNNMINIDDKSYITRDRYDLLRSGKVKEGDILFCLRGSLGKTALIKDIEFGAIASSLVIVRLFSIMYNKYTLAYFNSPLSKEIMKNYDNGTAQPNLSASDLGKFLVPIPPLSEQYHIVKKLDELMVLCDRLRSAIRELQTTQVNLADAVAQQLVE